MTRNIAYETYFLLENVQEVLSNVERRVAGLCTATRHSQAEWHFNFEIGVDLVRLAPNALLLRVEAADVVGCHSIKAVLEGAVAEFADFVQAAVLWIPAGTEPFVSLANRLGFPTL